MWNELTLGQRIKALREGSGLTQTALAQEVGCTRNRIRSWEIGEGVPSLGMFEALCKALDTHPNELLGW